MVHLRKLMSNVLFLKYFVINYVLNFMYIYNAQWKIYPKWKHYDFARVINCTHKLTWVCACRCMCDCTHLREQYAYPPNNLKNQNLKKMKKYLEMSSFYISVPKIMIRWCTVPKIWCTMDGWTDGRTEKVTYRGGCPT